jgi:hypothetical protein
MSSLFSTSRLVSCAYVMVFIFHVTFLIPASISHTPAVSVLYSLHILNRPGDKIQPCLTPFWIRNHSVVPWSTCTLASYSVHGSRINTVKCLGVPTLLVLFHIFKCCTLLKPLCNLKNGLTFLWRSLALPLIHLQ